MREKKKKKKKRETCRVETKYILQCERELKRIKKILEKVKQMKASLVIEWDNRKRMLREIYERTEREKE